jgi:hypothetical protein
MLIVDCGNPTMGADVTSILRYFGHLPDGSLATSLRTTTYTSEGLYGRHQAKDIVLASPVQRYRHRPSARRVKRRLMGPEASLLCVFLAACLSAPEPCVTK